MVEVKKILYPCDLTQNSTKILPYVLSMAEKYGSMIYLLHVVQDLSEWGGFFIPHISFDIFQKEAVQAAEKALDKVCQEKLGGCPNFQKRLVVGDPAEEILKAVEAEGIDMVIMGTHGAKGLEHTLFGSVADKVVRKSHVPIMVVNPHRLKR